MKEILFLIVVKIMMTFNISGMKPDQKVNFKCSYKGKEQDIQHFLNTANLRDIKNFRLMSCEYIHLFD